MIILLTTGGTIAMRHDVAAGGNVPALDGEGLRALAPGIEAIAPVRVEDFARRPAVHLTQDDLWALREKVRALLAEPSVRGVVVTHGTDLLEETAYLLDRTLQPRVPVVVTGAMRTSDAPDWDGTRNLLDAVRVAADARAAGKGVLVVFAGKVLRGLEAVKLDAMALDAFAAPHGAPLGEVRNELVIWSRGGDGVPSWTAPMALRPRPLAPFRLTARVALLPMAIGDDGTVAELLRPHFDGLVVESYGSGNTPPGALPALGRWLEEGKPVVLASRCPFGVVTPSYGFEGGGARTVAMGLTPAGPRSAWQARLELVIARSAGVPYAFGLPA